MSIQTDIQSALRSTVAIFGSSSWQYRSLTSANDAETATYGTAAAFTAHQVSLAVTLAYDDKGHDYRKVQRAQIKCTDAVVLKIGDQCIDPAGKHWHVAEVQDASDMDGIKRYVIERAVDAKGADKSKGGL